LLAETIRVCRTTTGYRRHAHSGHFPAAADRVNISWVAPRLVCVECRRPADAQARGWQGHLVEADDDEGDEVVFFCPLCAAREFGDLHRRPLDPPAR
jgi:hypothetical protein